ncbi:SH3 domain-containing kinase-binding protein 1 [Bagarius yarrelli]|uniref:Osteoclast-stimulating factor 1 n=1 Tax=Bagarius yarrelli TaxID=175774 RepID=A0A556TQE6_BAGYA|nr:SH3 domain-containing kinase-binding protein 1 [Bagarius yarrelli]
MGDEITVRVGDVVKNVTPSIEEGWLEGELRGKRGIFPSNFVKHQDELELVAGEIIEIIREIEDGWWMGKKGGKIGAFPSNFVKEIFVCSKDVKSRAKLSEAIFIKEGAPQQRVSLRRKTNIKECCQVMFDYTASDEDELNLKKGDIVTIINKVTDDDGWWEGELNGQRGFFPDNFVMIIPMEALQEKSQPPLRRGTLKQAVNQVPVMDKTSNGANTKTETKEEKSEVKDVKIDMPGKIKMPSLFKAQPPPIKDKPQKPASSTNNNKCVLQATGNDLPLTNKASTVVEPQNPTQTEAKPSGVPTLEQVLAELKELRMELELFRTQHEIDIKELKEELNDERSKRMKLQKVTRLEFAAACTKIVTAVSSAVVLRLLKPLSKNFGIEAILEANDKLKKISESKSRKCPAPGTNIQGSPIEASDFICHLGHKIITEIKGAMLEAIRSTASQDNGSMQVLLQGKQPILKLEELSMACTNEICDRILDLYLSEELDRPTEKKSSELSLKSQQEVQGIMKSLEKVVAVTRSSSRSTASLPSEWFSNPLKVIAPACASTAAQTEKPLSDEFMNKASQVVSEVLLKTEQKLAASMSTQNSAIVCSETELNFLMELAKSTATEILQKLFLTLVQSLNGQLSATICSNADQSEQEDEQKFVSGAQQIHRDIRKQVFAFFRRRKQTISEKSKTSLDECLETPAELYISSGTQESPEQFLDKATRVASDILVKRLNSQILTGLIGVKAAGSSTKQSLVASVDMDLLEVSDNKNNVGSDVALETEVTSIENEPEAQQDDQTNVQQLIDAETNPQPSVQSSSFVPLPLFTVVHNQLKAFITSFSKKSAKSESDEDRVVPICITDDGLVYELTEPHAGQSLSDSALGRRKVMLTSIPFPSEFIYVFVDESVKALLKNVLNTGSSDEDAACSPNATEDQENNRNEGIKHSKKKKKKKKSSSEDELTGAVSSDLNSVLQGEPTASRSVFKNIRKALGRFCSKRSTKCPQSENTQ